MAGSIEKRGENTYRLVVSTGKNLDGSRARRTKTIHGTRKDAEIALAEFVTEANRGLVPEGKPVTFEEFYHIWQVNYGTKDLAPSTYNRYVGMLESRILPYLGSFTLEKIKPTDLMKLYDMLEQDTQIKRLAKMFSIEDRLEEPIKGYSHGMKQKISIIAALAHKPKLLILDEPFVGLDPKATFELKEELKNLCKDGSMVFFSSHVLDVVEKFCNKIAIIKHGLIVESGDTLEIKGEGSLEDKFMEIFDNE